MTGALSFNNQVINDGNPSEIGIFDIFKYLRKIDLVYLNWIEELPRRRGGMTQTLVFILLFGYLKLRRKKIVWTLHNKKSHTAKHEIFKSILINLLLRRSDLIITHASEGLTLIPDKTRKVYFPHPVSSIIRINPNPVLKNYDIIIWGSIKEYKGVDTFLYYLIKEGLIHKYKIVIAGTVIGSELEDQLKIIDKEYNNVTLINRFVEKNELMELIEQSRIILFCYHSESILSSGALMYSLHFNSTIIGPNVGAFYDLAEEGIIFTFEHYDDLIMTIDEQINDTSLKAKEEAKKLEFMEDNSWEAFSEKVDELLRQL